MPEPCASGQVQRRVRRSQAIAKPPPLLGQGARLDCGRRLGLWRWASTWGLHVTSGAPVARHSECQSISVDRCAGRHRMAPLPCRWRCSRLAVRPSDASPSRLPGHVLDSVHTASRAHAVGVRLVPHCLVVVRQILAAAQAYRERGGFASGLRRCRFVAIAMGSPGFGRGGACSSV
jgi:hypothetical protein